MSESKDGGPAFPLGMDTNGRCDGMSLRDYFAGQALAGLTQEIHWSNAPSAHERAQKIADTCYMVADAMLAERSKSK